LRVRSGQPLGDGRSTFIEPARQLADHPACPSDPADGHIAQADRHQREHGDEAQQDERKVGLHAGALWPSDHITRIRVHEQAREAATEQQADRRVVLRHEVSGDDRRFLEAWLGDAGELHIDGQDLGPGTAIVSDDGEYEFFMTIVAEHLAELRLALGIGPFEDLLDALESRWTGEASHELERRLSKARFPVRLSVW
jgi:hypothetical protein